MLCVLYVLPCLCACVLCVLTRSCDLGSSHVYILARLSAFVLVCLTCLACLHTLAPVCVTNCVTYVLGARCTLLSYLFLFQVLNLRNSYSERFICNAELNIFLVAFLYQLKRKQESQ